MKNKIVLAVMLLFCAAIIAVPMLFENAVTAGIDYADLTVHGYMATKELASSTTPDSGFGKWYFKTADNKPYAKGDDGVEHGPLGEVATIHNAWMIADIYITEGDSPTDDEIIKYDSVTARWCFETDAGGSGDMTKAVYDNDTDDDIDVAAGGTEKSAWTAYCIPYLSGTTTFGEVVVGTAGYALVVNGTATGYIWLDIDGTYVKLTETSAVDFGGAASFEPPNGTDPDVTDTQLSLDTDGGSSANQAALRVGSDSKQKAIPLAKEIQFSILDPDDMATGAARATKYAPIWHNSTGYTFVIQEIWAEADADDHTFNLYETASRTDWSEASDSLIDELVCAANGTGVYTDYETTITDANIATGAVILYEYSSGATTRVHVTIKGYLDGNVD